MAAHHLSSERLTSLPWSPAPQTARGQSHFLRESRSPRASENESVVTQVQARKFQTSSDERFLAVTLPPSFCQLEAFVGGVANVWVGYAYPDELDAPDIYATSQTQLVPIAQREQPLSFTLPLTCSMTKQITVQVLIRTPRGTVQRVQLDDREIFRQLEAPATSQKMMKPGLR